MSLKFKFNSTANDSDKSWTVPTGSVWKVLYGNVKLVTTATVGNRQLRIEVLDDSSNIVYTSSAGAVQAASGTVNYNLSSNCVRETTVVDSTLFVPIPTDMMLSGGWSLRVYDQAAVDAAADDMTVSFVYDEI